MKNTIALVLIFSIGGGYSSAVQAKTYYTPGTPVTRTEPTSTQGTLTITQTTVNVSNDDSGTLVDEGNFTMHRVTLSSLLSKRSNIIGTITLQPGGGSNFASYELDENDVYENSLAGALAKTGYDVFGYSPRTYGIPANACESGALDCSVMKHWGMAAVVSDVNNFILPQTDKIHAALGLNPAKLKRVVGGWSLGAISSLAIINDRPTAYDGAWLYEGLGASYNQQINELNNDPATAYNCPTLQSKVAGSDYYDANVFTGVKYLNYLAMNYPNDPSAFIPGYNNWQAYHYLLGLAQPVYVPGYTLLSGDANGFYLASDERVNRMFGQLNAYEPNQLMMDYVCAFAGTELSFSSNLRRFKGKIFVTRGSAGFGSWMPQNLQDLGIKPNKITWGDGAYEGSAHADTYMRLDHATYLDNPLIEWLKKL